MKHETIHIISPWFPLCITLHYASVIDNWLRRVCKNFWFNATHSTLLKIVKDKTWGAQAHPLPKRPIFRLSSLPWLTPRHRHCEWICVIEWLASKEVNKEAEARQHTHTHLLLLFLFVCIVTVYSVLILRCFESRFVVRNDSNRHRFAAISNRMIRTERPKTVRVAVKALVLSLLRYVSHRPIRFASDFESRDSRHPSSYYESLVV